MASMSDITVLGLDNVLLDVGDLEVAKGFAGRLGLGVKFDFPDAGVVGFRLGDEEAGLVVRAGDVPRAAPSSPRLWLEVPDARAAGKAAGRGDLLGEPASSAPAGWSRSPTRGATWSASPTTSWPPSGPASARTAAASVTRTLLTGGRVFDGTGAPPGEADVLVEGDRILEVGPGWTATRRSTSAAATCCRGCSTATPTSP